MTEQAEEHRRSPKKKAVKKSRAVVKKEDEALEEGNAPEAFPEQPADNEVDKPKVKGLLTKKKKKRPSKDETSEKNDEDVAREQAPSTKRTRLEGFLCFKCGSDEHGVANCPQYADIEGMPHAKCYLCNRSGHLGSHCDQAKDVLVSIRELTSEDEVRAIVEKHNSTAECKLDVDRVVSRWFNERKGCKKSLDLSTLDTVEEGVSGLSELKDKLTGLFKDGKITRKDIARTILRWKSSEERRVRRRDDRLKGKACLRCRGDHLLKDCPQQTKGADSMCFKCGSTEHRVRECTRRASIKGFPNALCFVCGEKGHLSRDCAQNQNGVYPKGGACHECGSTAHLRRDCPNLDHSTGSNHIELTAARWKPGASADDDDGAFAIKSLDEDDEDGDATENDGKKPKKMTSARGGKINKKKLGGGGGARTVHF